MIFKSKCLICEKEFDNSHVQMRQYCSVGCQYDAGQRIKQMIKFQYEDDRVEMSIVNNINNNINISITGDRTEFIDLDMNDTIQRQALRDIAAVINGFLSQYSRERLEKLRFEKPGPDAVTVGDLIGLKREE